MGWAEGPAPYALQLRDNHFVYAQRCRTGVDSSGPVLQQQLMAGLCLARGLAVGQTTG